MDRAESTQRDAAAWRGCQNHCQISVYYDVICRSESSVNFEQICI
jgi:hypothetical protein